MIDIKKRNLKIVQTRNKGTTYQDIADLFGLSRERVRQIIIRSELDKKQRLQSEEIKEIIRLSDDINKKWPTDFLIDGLRFPKHTTRVLNKYFDRCNIIQFSLKDLMDFIIPERELFRARFWVNVPAFDEKGLGAKAYTSLVDNLSEQDLGHIFNAEWIKRLKILMQYLVKYDKGIPMSLHKYL